MSFLKPKMKLQNTNVNNDLLTKTYTPQMQTGVQGNNFLGSLLTGQGDVGAAQGGFDTFLKNAGYDVALKDAMRGVTGQGAASGLLRSGPTGNAYMQKAQDLRGGMFNNYLGNLLNLSNSGTQAASIVSNAGQGELVKKPSTAGSIASAVGGIASIFSDRRLKEDVVKLGEMSDGLGLYRFRYLGGVKRFVGVMADEVARLRPWALGPTVAGFSTVNLEAL